MHKCVSLFLWIFLSTFLEVQKGHHAWMSMHKCFNHNNIIMLECWKLNQGWSGIVIWKMNQWKICTSHYPETSSCLNVENWTKDEVVWSGGTEPMKKGKIGIIHYEKNGKVWVSAFLSVNRNGKLAFGIMKKMKNGYHLVEYHSTAKFPITGLTPPPLPKAWASIFLNVDGNGKLTSAIMTKWLPHCGNLFHKKFPIKKGF